MENIEDIIEQILFIDSDENISKNIITDPCQIQELLTEFFDEKNIINLIKDSDVKRSDLNRLDLTYNPIVDSIPIWVIGLVDKQKNKILDYYIVFLSTEIILIRYEDQLILYLNSSDFKYRLFKMIDYSLLLAEKTNL